MAKVKTTRSKNIILSHGRNLADTDYSVNEQKPREYEERRKMLMPLYKDAKKKRIPATWKNDCLKINDKLIQPTKDRIKDINIDSMMTTLEMKVKRGPPETFRGSSFQGAQVNIKTTDEVIPAIHAILEERKVGRANHNIYCYRIKRGDKVIEHYEDDGEYGAGRRLLSLLQEQSITNKLVCVSRWHMGPLLGKVRFEHIEEAAKKALRSNN